MIILQKIAQQQKKKKKQIKCSKCFNLDEEQTSLKTLMRDTHDSLNDVGSLEEIKTEIFKLIEGKNDPTTFLPLNANIG